MSRSPLLTFRVIWAKRDTGVRVGDDPNQMLCDLFRKEGRPAAVNARREQGVGIAVFSLKAALRRARVYGVDIARLFV